MRTIGYRFQRTLAGPAAVAGVGFITGRRVRVRFQPAPADSGVIFVRTDCPGAIPIPARAAAVTDTRRRTTLGPAANSVTLVEHVLAALSGLRIDNCRLELDGPEPPGLDGSAWGFVEALQAAGIVTQATRRPICTVEDVCTAHRGDATIALHPAEDDDPSLRASYILDYGPTAIIPRQAATFAVRPDTFVRDLAGCRTFLLEHEAAALKAQGVGTHLTTADVLVFGPRGLLGNRLRYADEPARHKVLDLIGDLALTGFDLAGHVVAYRSGHALNVDLAKALTKRSTAGAEVRPAVLPFRRVSRAA